MASLNWIPLRIPVCMCRQPDDPQHWRYCAYLHNRLRDYGAYMFCLLHQGAEHPEVPGEMGQVVAPWGVLVQANDLLQRSGRPMSMENTEAMQPAIDCYLDLCTDWGIEPEACSWAQRSKLPTICDNCDDCNDCGICDVAREQA